MRRLKALGAALAGALATAPGLAPEAHGQTEAGGRPALLSLSGRINRELTYRVRLDYATTVNDLACKFDDQITGMWVAQVRSRFFSPTITGDSHSLQIPTDAPEGADSCGWTAQAAFICVGPRGGAGELDDCRPLLVMSAVGGAPPRDIDLLCRSGGASCMTPQGTDPVRQIDRFAATLKLNIDKAASLH